ncbi:MULTISPECIES: long-chain-fatty-acid--CoA ligase [Mycolicibacterium]|uniref:Long-chain-fatty-acid--CoA ligase FadD13 n=2 Tax=Mycolicibacterium chitae TaxID=1792 RepID=A0A448I663_MYCCI|nr:long-chain-fatty-acid--CoA ligase [Mycolicibacterium chitae]MCV7104981.1 long-chain-fatty-acid--CoA ligase [Mycolicibacterium chitae]VEG47870.1 feruloyl-CoA synthetase [Mycolicibacterium chitae]
MYLTQGFHRSLQRDPDAVMTVHGDRTRTFGEVADRVARLAAAIRRLGVRSHDRVGVLALNSDRYTEAILATAWADAVLTPVNTRWVAGEIAYSLADCECSVLIVDDAFAPLGPALKSLYPGLTTLIHCGDAPCPDGMLSYEGLIAEHEPIADARRSGSALAGLFYTGGTTGFPKGVMLSHANIVTSGLGAAGHGLFRAGGTYLHVAPMFHLADFTGWIVQTLLGGKHVSVPAFNPDTLLDVIEQQQVTGMTLVPAMIQAIVDNPGTAGRDLGCVESILYGGSPIAQGLLKKAMDAFPRAGFTQAYGMTELAGLATFLLPSDHQLGHLESAGRALLHTEVRIQNADGAVLPVGSVGEIAVRGGNIMQGYWNRPDDTAAAIVDGWLRTGDVGRLDDQGYLYIVDRLKDMIVTGGENVYSVEVENALSAHPAVRDCAVIGLPDDRWGERVHAVVVLREQGTSPDDLRVFVKSAIAGYKTPRTFEFVESLPRTPTGKVLKRDLRSERLSTTDEKPAPAI